MKLAKWPPAYPKTTNSVLNSANLYILRVCEQAWRWQSSHTPPPPLPPHSLALHNYHHRQQQHTAQVAFVILGHLTFPYASSPFLPTIGHGSLYLGLCPLSWPSALLDYSCHLSLSVHIYSIHLYCLSKLPIEVSVCSDRWQHCGGCYASNDRILI